jgi:hypothetical protein
LKVDTGVPAVHEMMNTLGEEPPGLAVEPFFNGDPDLIIVCELPSFKSFLEWTKDMVVAR